MRAAPIWNREIDAQVDMAIAHVLVEVPGAQVSIRELCDDRGVVAIVVCATDGRLVGAVRSIDLAPVAWPWPLAAGTAGVLPRSQCPTVEEFLAGLTSTEGM